MEIEETVKDKERTYNLPPGEEKFKQDISGLKQEYQNIVAERDECFRKLAAVHEKSDPGAAPEASIYIFEPMGFLWICAFAIFIPLHCVVWILKLMFDISWDTWGWVITAFYCLLPLSAIIAFVGYLQYRKVKGYWEDDHNDYIISDTCQLRAKVSELSGKINELYLKIYFALDSNRNVAMSKSSEPELREYFINSRGRLFTHQKNMVKHMIADVQSESEYLDRRNKELKHLRKPGGKEPTGEEIGENVVSVWFIAYVGLIALHLVLKLCGYIAGSPWGIWDWITNAYYIVAPVSIIVGFVYYKKYLKEKTVWANANYRYEIAREEIKVIEAQKKELASKKSKLTHLSFLYDDRCNRYLQDLIRDNLLLPIRTIEGWSYKDANKTYWRMFDRYNELKNISDPNEKVECTLKYFNDKLALFYRYSMPSEAASSPEIYKPFGDQFKKSTIDSLRQNFTPYGATIKSIEKLIDQYDVIDVDEVIDEFNGILSRDVSGFFTEHDSSKVEKQTKELQACCNAFTGIINDSVKLAKQLNTSLGMARMVAYRNLYLGAEIINVVRENGGGGKLLRADDELTDFSTSELEIDEIAEFSTTTALKDILSTTAESVLNGAVNMLGDKKSRKYYKDNPKAAAGVLAVAAVTAGINAGIEAWKKRNAKIANCLTAQQKLIPEMERLVNVYQDNLAGISRAYEISESLINVNNGFTAVYEPLSRKVFGHHRPSSVSIKELQELVLAMKEYKSIADTKL